MQVVINIDDDVYKRALVYKDVQLASNSANDLSELITAVANGTPLPKGHGELVDKNDVVSVILFSKLFDSARCSEVTETLNNIPTIIEVDKEVGL